MKIRADYDYIVIGGGVAGITAASEAAKWGAKTLLVSAESLGGDYLYHGCVPSKSFLQVGKIINQARAAEVFGFSITQATFEWENMLRHISEIQDKIQQKHTPEFLRSLGCEVIFGRAEFLDETKIQISLLPNFRAFQPEFAKGKELLEISGTSFCLATGARPRIPEIPGLLETGFLTNEQIFKIPERPESLAIIGGGTTAIEVAQAFLRFGTKVVILDKHDTFLDFLDGDVAQVVTQKLLKEGLEVWLQSIPEKVEKVGNKKQITFKVQGKTEKIEADEIFLAVGKIPNTDLQLGAAGVEFSEKGIKVNNRCKTTQRNISAIGDCNGKSLFTPTAHYEATVAIRNQILHWPKAMDYDRLGWTIFTDPEVASIGYNEKTARIAQIECDILKLPFEKNDRAQIENATEGFIKVLAHKDRVIGCQIVGARAGEMIREWQMALEQKISLRRIADSTYIYPTFGESSKWMADMFFAPKRYSEGLKRFLRILCFYRGE